MDNIVVLEYAFSELECLQFLGLIIVSLNCS